MHSFWTLFRAEFAVEILSKFLFSGKFPRPVAIFLILVVSGFLFVFWCVKIIYQIAKWIFIRDSSKTKIVFFRIRMIGKKFGDNGVVIQDNNSLTLRLTNRNFKHSITALHIEIEKGTGRLEFSVEFQENMIHIPYQFLNEICPRDVAFSLHRDFAPYLYHTLRINYL